MIAVSAGISDGMGFGANAYRFSTRGIAEITRLGVRWRLQIIPLSSGMSGLGDLNLNVLITNLIIAVLV